MIAIMLSPTRMCFLHGSVFLYIFKYVGMYTVNTFLYGDITHIPCLMVCIYWCVMRVGHAFHLHQQYSYRNCILPTMKFTSGYLPDMR